MKTHIIAFVAPKGYGKTTACNIIKDHYQVAQLNFKDGLIRELKQNFPDLLAVLRERYNLTDEKLFAIKPPEVRALMMNYGTEVRRKDDPNYWVMQWKLGLIDLMNGGATVILNDDTRFQNEYDAVRAYGGTLIRIERSDMQSTDTHQSETEQRSFECDYTITTRDGELELFTQELLDIVKRVVQ